jgi:hypothetical protein
MRGRPRTPTIDVMNSNNLSRPLLWAAVGAGVADALIATLDLLGARGIVDNAQPAGLGYLEQALVVAGDVCFLLAWMGIGTVHAAAGRWGRIGRAAVRLALVAGTMILLANTVTLVAWPEQLMPLHVLGFFLWLAGSVAVAVAGWGSGVLPRWLLVAFAICPIVVWAGPLGQYAYGAVWVLVGSALLQDHGRRVGHQAALTPTL